MNGWPLALIILAAWFALSLIVAPFAGRWLKASRIAAEAQWDAAERDSTGTVRLLDDDDPRVQAKRSDEKGAAP